MFPFKPLSKQFDYGFGGYADAFKRAADELNSQKNDGETFLNMHLPINYMYRHAIELYLKSIIIVVHRRLQLPFGENDSESTPCVFVNNKWKPIHRVHSIGDLYKYFLTTVSDNADFIGTFTNSDWSSPPPELDSHIMLIEEFDSRSTFLRYPDTRNLESEQEKSSFQNSSIYDIFSRMAPGKEYSKATIVLDEHDEIVEVYQFERDPLLELVQALEGAASLLQAAHLGIRVEFADGE